MQRFLCAEEILGHSRTWLGCVQVMQSLPSAEPTLTADEFACAVLVGTVEDLEANPKKVEAQRGKGVTRVVKESKEDIVFSRYSRDVCLHGGHDA